MEIKENKKLKKNLHRFVCKSCDFKCYMKCDWDRHLTRAKHLDSLTGNDGNEKNLKKTYYCVCGKNFMSNSGLWKHKQKCPIVKDKNNTIISSDLKDIHSIDKDDLILKLLKDNERSVKH